MVVFAGWRVTGLMVSVLKKYLMDLISNILHTITRPVSDIFIYFH